MAKAVTIELRADPLEPTTGLWCNDCALPSAFDVEVLISHAESLALLSRLRVWACTNCRKQRHHKP